MNIVEVKIPKGYSGIDEERSDFDKGVIILKKEESKIWRYKNVPISGFSLRTDSHIIPNQGVQGNCFDRNIFYSKEQAESARAMAELSQIMANDKRFGKPFTDEEWGNGKIVKYVIGRHFEGSLFFDESKYTWCFLAFRTDKQRELFYTENEDLIKQYYMIK